MRRGALAAEEHTSRTASDAGLVAAALDGDSAAFGELVGRYKGMVMGRIHAIVRDWHESEDLAQEAFVRAYGALSQLRSGAEFPAWIGMIARNVARTHSAKRRPAPTGAAGGGAPALPSSAGTPDPAETAARRELYEKALGEIEGLPEGYRSTVYMRYQKNLSCREIAEIEGVSVGVVTSRLARAAAALRERLAPLAGEGDS